MKKLLLSTLAVLALGAAVQTAQAADTPKTVFVIGEFLTVVGCDVAGAFIVESTNTTNSHEKFCVLKVNKKVVNAISTHTSPGGGTLQLS